MAGSDQAPDNRDLFAGTLTLENARLAMDELGARQKADFDERTRLRVEHADVMRQVAVPIRDLVSPSAQSRTAINGLRGLSATARQRELPPPVQAADEERIFTGSFGHTRPAPFNTIPHAQVAGQPQHSEVLDGNTGDIHISMSTDLNDNDSSVFAWGALGFPLHPPVENGLLELFATPSLSFKWGTFCSDEGAHADAWIGFIVNRFTLQGAPDGDPVVQQGPLWSDDSWWSGTGLQFGSKPFGLMVPPFAVDSDHQYWIWVWAGGSVSAAGWGDYFGSEALNDLRVHLPSITWALF
jgi:hypothetical protein